MNTGNRDVSTTGPGSAPVVVADDDGLGLLDIAVVMAENLKLLIIGPLVAGVVVLGITYLIPPTFTARTTFVPPIQQQSIAAASALASLGPLAGLVGGAGGIKSPADQYVALMQSSTVQDRLIDQYKLMQVYDAKYRFQARDDLRANVRIVLGKKDGLISVEVDDEDPKRAADLANSHIDELRRMTTVLAVTEAQQRRLFFEQQLARSKERLTKAQETLQASGFSQGALQAEPKAAADSYARLKAQVTAAEVRLQTMRSYLNENAAEFQNQLAALGALRGQLNRAEQVVDPQAGPDYIGKYREFKYEEALFELFARQYEMARLDESREGGLIQVVDVAQVPEWKSKPKRAVFALGATVVAFVLLVLFVLSRHAWRQSFMQPDGGDKIARIRAALRAKRSNEGFNT
ncbi:MAG: lipopolysaccharide biosynthesis protein [Betaproteobacteria bacterium]|nr:lipopolysaccharide biosynthesis protein [Betaproteobacteria bacterium]